MHSWRVQKHPTKHCDGLSIHFISYRISDRYLLINYDYWLLIVGKMAYNGESINWVSWVQKTANILKVVNDIDRTLTLPVYTQLESRDFSFYFARSFKQNLDRLRRAQSKQEETHFKEDRRQQQRQVKNGLGDNCSESNHDPCKRNVSVHAVWRTGHSCQAPLRDRTSTLCMHIRGERIV